jgi:type IV fimbrial biogenesis protein FimT
MTTESGFTLIELLIVVAIFSIISAITIPSMVGWRAGYKLKRATRDLLMVLQHARRGAVKANKKVIVTFTPEGHSLSDGWYTAFVDNGADKNTFWTRQTDEHIVKKGRIPEGIRFHDVSFAGGIPRIRFNGLGLPNGFGGHIYLTDTKNKFMGIHININGSPRIVRSKSGLKGSWD